MQIRARSLGASVVLALLLTALVTAAPRSSLAAEPARAADDVVDSLCINTHPWYDDWTTITEKLRELGIRCIRDGISGGEAARYRSLYQDHGIRSILISDYRQQDGAAVRDFVKEVGPEAVIAVENNNEPAGFVGGGTWAQDTRQHQVDLWNAIKGDPATADVAVVASSPLGPQDVEAVGDVSQWADWGNVHNYYGGRHPETQGWGEDGYGSLDFTRRRLSQPAVGGKPFISTETGYHNALGTTSGHRPASERAAGKYMPRLYLSHFMNGMPYTAPYEFWDEGTDPADHEQNFGLLRHDHSPKPAFTAVKNLIALLSDPGADFAPGTLDYELSGQTDNLQQLLLQQRDGTFYLALWQGVSAWDVDAQQDIEVAPAPVTLTLGAPVEQAAVCQPNESADCTPVEVDGGSIELSVPDEVLLVRLGGGAAPQPGDDGETTGETPATPPSSPSPAPTAAPEDGADPQDGADTAPDLLTRLGDALRSLLEQLTTAFAGLFG